MFTALTDHLSRYSMEDLPLAAHPSPALIRKFPSVEKVSYSKEQEQYAEGEEEEERGDVSALPTRLLVILVSLILISLPPLLSLFSLLPPSSLSSLPLLSTGYESST